MRTRAPSNVVGVVSEACEPSARPLSNRAANDGIDPTVLIARWQEDEERFRFYGQLSPADILRRCREDLWGWWRERELTLLTIEEACTFSGYTESGLQKLRERGELSDRLDEHGRRCYVLGELPRKVRRPRVTLETGEPDLAGEVLRSKSRAGA